MRNNTNDEPEFLTSTREVYDEFLNRKGPNHPNRQQVAQLISERKRGVIAGIAKMLHHLHLGKYEIEIKINEPQSDSTI